MAADPANRQILAVGQGSTWRWNSGTWQLLQSVYSPPIGAMSNLVYDPKLRAFVVTVLPYDCCMANLP
jgi:hypothetical protein